MFEVTIVCRSLPRSTNEIDKVIPIANTLIETPVDITSSQRQVTDRHRKQIRHEKRQVLLTQLETFESIIEEMEYVYQETLLTLKLGLSSQTDRVEACMQCINSYLNHRTERIMRAIRYKETVLRMKLKHPRHRSSTSSMNTAMSVYPEAIVETSSSVFSNQELDFLSSTGHVQSLFSAITVFLPFRWSELHQKESKLSLPQEEHSTEHWTRAVQNNCQTRAWSVSSSWHASRIEEYEAICHSTADTIWGTLHGCWTVVSRYLSRSERNQISPFDQAQIEQSPMHSSCQW